MERALHGIFGDAGRRCVTGRRGAEQKGDREMRVKGSAGEREREREVPVEGLSNAM